MSFGTFTLALDCTGLQGSAALLKGTRLVAERSWVRGQSHAELVIPAIESILFDGKIGIKNIDLLAVCSGPGSFTGVRVGINVIKTFSYSFHIPVVLITSLELWAESFLQKNQSAVIAIPAHDGTYFSSLIKKDAQDFLLCAPVQRATDKDLELLKSGQQVLIAEFDQPWPKAEVLAKIALREASKRQTKDWKEVLPLYVRASSAEEKIRKG